MTPRQRAAAALVWLAASSIGAAADVPRDYPVKPVPFTAVHFTDAFWRPLAAGTKYPAVLFTTGDADTRVPPLQARKMTARMQAASDRPVLLLYDTKAGHAGGRPIGKIVEDLSLEMAFLAWQLGMEPR
jgi:hypothetical protein